MSSIYSMEMSFKFILQATRILHIGNYDDSELKMIYDYLTSLDSIILNEYYNTTTLISYSNDLELYLEIITALISIYEDMEEYEKCYVLKIKRDEAIKIINKNKN